jgi:hypothetical protein
MIRFQIADHTGHSTVDFARDAAGIAEAERKFNALVSQGNAAFAKRGSGDARKVTALDPAADTHLFMAPLQGG